MNGMSTAPRFADLAGRLMTIVLLYACPAIADTTPPAKVSGFTATANPPGTISLSWTNPGDPDFAGVTIRRTTGGFAPTPADGTGVYNGTGTGTVDSDPALVTGATYFYTAFSYDGVPNYSLGAYAAATCIDTVAPGTITAFLAFANVSGSISLLWTNPGDADFAGVMIRRATGGYPATIASGTLVYSGSGTSKLDNDPALAHGVTYYYGAFTYDEKPNYSARVGVSTTCVDTVAPGPATAFAAVANADGSVSLSWSLPADTDLQGVMVRRATGGYPATAASGTLVYNGMGTGKLDDDPLMVSGTTYYYGAFSYDEKPNYGTRADAVAVCVDATAPGSPASFTATANADGSVSLAWSNPGDADLQGVVVRRATGGYPATAASGTLVYDGTGTGKLDDDPALVTGTTYYYGAFSYDEIPNYSARADDAAVCVDTVPPGAVTGFTTIAGAPGSIDLAWTNPDDQDFAGVMVRRGADSYPATVGTGALVYDGTGSSVTDTVPVIGPIYYYSAFSYDEVPNASVAHASNDADQDGMADEWEIAVFGGTSQPQGAATNDADNDGASNIDEYLAGTDPNVPSSVFRLVTLSPAAGMTFRWLSVTNRVYSIYRSTNLTETWPALPVTNGIPGDPSGTNSYTHPGPDGTPHFYRLTADFR